MVDGGSRGRRRTGGTPTRLRGGRRTSPTFARRGRQLIRSPECSARLLATQHGLLADRGPGPVAMDLRSARRVSALDDTTRLHDHVVRGVLESIDCALREQDVVEHREPLAPVAIARHEGRRASGAPDDRLVDVATLFTAHRFERDVAVDEQVDGADSPHRCACWCACGTGASARARDASAPTATGQTAAV